MVGPRVSACWHCPGRIRRDSQIARVKPNQAKFIFWASFTFWMGKMLGFQDLAPLLTLKERRKLDTIQWAIPP